MSLPRGCDHYGFVVWTGDEYHTKCSNCGLTPVPPREWDEKQQQWTGDKSNPAYRMPPINRHAWDDLKEELRVRRT